MSKICSEDPYIIAEVGGNHGGDFELAKRYVKTAADAGADAVKFQLYRAEKLIVEEADPLPLAGNDYDSQYERFRELEFTEEQWRELAALADKYEVDFAASVFDREMVNLTAELSPFIKIASGDLTNTLLLRHINELGKPVILSTGFATMEEIRSAVRELSDVELTLLHCVGSYPTPDDEVHLEMLGVLDRTFNVSVGYSDHTAGTRAPLAAVANGASIIEKHFTLDKSQNVGDHRLSANPEEMEQIVKESQRINDMFGDFGRESFLPIEEELRTEMRRSLSVLDPVSEGEMIDNEVLMALRPATGIEPRRLDDIVGRRVNTDIEPGKILTKSHLRDNE